MTRSSIDSVIAYIRSEGYARGPGATDTVKPVITIARDHGAGGEAIGQILARSLDVGYFDKGLIDDVTKAAGLDPTLMKTLDDQVKDHLGVFLYATLYGMSDPIREYQKSLVKAVMGIGRMGGVIMGRGANLILQGKPVLRVRITGSIPVCARRLAGGDESRTKDLTPEIEAINRQRATFIWNVFGVKANDPVHYDIMINTDHFDDLNEAAGLILAAFDRHTLTRAIHRTAPLPHA